MRGFVSARYDATGGEGLALAERYAVQGLPTLVVVDGHGRELDRIEGFLSAEALSRELERIRGSSSALPRGISGLGGGLGLVTRAP